MNYKEKYRNALERAKSFCKRWDGLKIDSSSLVIQEVKEFFPELDNLEDEIMRENLYKCLHCYVPNDKAEEFIAWLEKRDKTMLNKACEWLHTALYLDHEHSIEHRYATLEELLNDFREAMEGGEE